MSNSTTGLMLSDRTYNAGKQLVQIILPAVSSLYFGLAAIWDLPRAEQVVGTLAVIATFIGMMLGVSSRTYESSGAAYDGQMVIHTPPNGKKIFSLELDLTPEEIEELSSINFKVLSSEDEPDPFAE